MEPKFQTSFIPKKPIVTASGTGVSVVHETNILSIVATVVFIVTLLTSGGLFAYKKSLQAQVDAGDAAVLAATNAIKPDEIRGLVDTDYRIAAAKTLLDKHIVVSRMLSKLEELTLRKMRFASLVYKNQNDDPKIIIKGEVQTYNALAQQEDVLSKNEFIKNPQFSNFNLGDNGYISVDFSAGIDSKLLSYKDKIGAADNAGSSTLTP